mgnify:CR=1 FL=1
MAFRHKYSYEEKERILIEYLSGAHGFRELCRIIQHSPRLININNSVHSVEASTAGVAGAVFLFLKARSRVYTKAPIKALDISRTAAAAAENKAMVLYLVWSRFNAFSRGLRLARYLRSRAEMSSISSVRSGSGRFMPGLRVTVPFSASEL